MELDNGSVERNIKSKKLSLFTVIVNIAMLIVLVFMSLTIDLFKNSHGLIHTGGSPISLLKFLFFIFVIIGSFLHFKQGNWSSIIMILLFTFFYFGFKSDMQDLSFVLNLNPNGDTEVLIAQNKLSAFRNIALFPLAGAILYLVITILRVLKKI
ncbi:hypothetical protein IIO_04964 [Bacillus cereus VD115]|nr:hypothetical protein IIO_04964 [Bacillus cereus VD115]